MARGLTEKGKEGCNVWTKRPETDPSVSLDGRERASSRSLHLLAFKNAHAPPSLFFKHLPPKPAGRDRLSVLKCNASPPSPLESSLFCLDLNLPIEE